jgi:6-phosphogluconolactonase (cycloisomerase 2 family)
VKGSGQLMPVAGSPFVAAPITQSFGPANRMAVDQTDKFLYLATSTGLIGYTIEPATGALTMIPGSPFGATVKNAFSIVVVASEQLYESPYASTGGIYGYSIDKNTGVLTAINGSPFNASCAGSVNMTSPAEGKFLFAAGCGMFSIDATTGALTKLFPDTTNPPVDWPVFDPSGKFLWIITQDQNCWHCDVGVSAYDVNPNSGAFTPVPNSFFVMQNSMTGAIVSLAITQ